MRLIIFEIKRPWLESLRKANAITLQRVDFMFSARFPLSEEEADTFIPIQFII